jgi:hypothetical protein
MWADAWLAREGSRVPITPRHQSILVKVSELINPHTADWDETLARDNFWEADASVLLSLPPRGDFEDWPAWHFDEKGQFSVKSAYRVYVNLGEKEQNTSNRNAGNAVQWKKVCKVPCQPKVKQFIWRVAHNSLPLRVNIKRRGIIDCDTVCLLQMDGRRQGTYVPEVEGSEEAMAAGWTR